MIQKIKIIKTLIIIFSSCLSFSANAQTVEEIIKGRKAMFSENYQNAKRISILLKSKKLPYHSLYDRKKTPKQTCF